MRWGIAAIAVAVACQSDGFFVCNDNGDCGGGDGVCESVGACSFPDPECESGRRFGESSQPSIAGECTNGDPATSGATGSTTGSTTLPPSSESTDAADSAEGSNSTGVPGCPPDWWDCDWTRRVRIGLTELPDPPLTDFAVLVLLGPARVDYEHLQADAEDLRFVSSRGNALPFEIESWDPTSVSIAWVSIDEIGPASDHFFLYYANPAAQDAQDPAAVWPDPYAAVWHMSEGTADSTRYGNHATPTRRVLETEGQIGAARELLTPPSRLDVAPSESLADIFVGGGTITAWIRPFDWGGADFGRIVHREPGTGVGFIFYVGSPGQIRFQHYGGSAGPTWNTPNNVIALHRWSHVAVTYEAGSGELPRLFMDGTEIALVAPAAAPSDLAPTDADVPITLGNRTNNDRLFEGKLDELRIEHAVRSPDWIRLQHLSGRDTLLVFGPPEQHGGVP
jgi:hypothetical protein